CLILEDHPIIGGEAKRNQFVVRGQRLIGPQGSNESGYPRSGLLGDIWKDCGLPTEFEFAKLSPDRRQMEFPLDNYMSLLWEDISESQGFFSDRRSPPGVPNPWGRALEGPPWPEDVRRDLLRWRDEPMEPFKGDETALEQWLDTM